MSTQKDAVAQLINWVGVLLVLASALFACLCWGYQLLMFLRTGEWFAIGVMDALAVLLQRPWLAYGIEGWAGLYTVLQWFNGGFVIGLTGVLIAGVLLNFE